MNRQVMAEDLPQVPDCGSLGLLREFTEERGANQIVCYWGIISVKRPVAAVRFS
jgi:hypothetical protein